ncbi:beta-ketoacyl synthase chain length factor [Desulfovibrio sp. OttesenSCG-928-C06]|nr:beta-ketoacyl synthase chain length factor [Desulfovibrio sp. OttesenSCG-928-C06]
MRKSFYLNGVGLHYGESGLGDFATACLNDGPADFCNAPALKDVLPGLNLRRTSPISKLALSAAAQALAHSGNSAPLSSEKSARAGLFIGSAFGAAGSSFAFMDSILDGGAQLASPTHFSHSVNNVFCGFLSMSLNIQGPSCTVCQFDLSFAGALQTGLCALAAGDIDLAVVGAVEEASRSMSMVQAAAVPAEHAPMQDCAVFFVISRQAGASSPMIAFPEWSHGRSAGVTSSNLVRLPEGLADAAEPALQALELAAAFVRSSASGTAEGMHCRKADEKRGIAVDILIESPSRVGA